jgi:hypothetical protein
LDRKYTITYFLNLCLSARNVACLTTGFCCTFLKLLRRPIK